jgi:hypothetical protein
MVSSKAQAHDGSMLSFLATFASVAVPVMLVALHLPGSASAAFTPSPSALPRPSPFGVNDMMSHGLLLLPASHTA